jgi:hypothetical protein
MAIFQQLALPEDGCGQRNGRGTLSFRKFAERDFLLSFGSMNRES